MDLGEIPHGLVEFREVFTLSVRAKGTIGHALQVEFLFADAEKLSINPHMEIGYGRSRH